MTTTTITLHDVATETGGRLVGSAPADLPLAGVGVDSRSVQPGALFVALAGPQFDGHNFVAEAFARGAAAALVERVPSGDVRSEAGEGPPLVVVPSALAALQTLAGAWRRRHQAEVAVVVGSVGRATTAELAAAVLHQHFGVERASAVERPELQLPLALLQLGPRASRLVLELGVLADDQRDRLLTLAAPSAVVVTNVQATHHEPAEALDEIAARRARLLAGLGPDETAILNADDPRTRDMLAATRAAPILFGLGSAADVRADNVVGHGLQGIELDLTVGRRTVHVRLPLIGLNSVHSALAAASVGLAAGLELREIGAGLQTASPTTRILLATGINGSRIVDDSYNAGPESDLEALNLLAELAGRKVAVLGDMLGLGQLETAGHQKVGNRAALVADELIAVGDRARLIADEARRVGLDPDAVFEVDTNEAAIELLERRLRPGDNVLLKGSRELGFDRIAEAIRLEG